LSTVFPAESKDLSSITQSESKEQKVQHKQHKILNLGCLSGTYAGLDRLQSDLYHDMDSGSPVSRRPGMTEIECKIFPMVMRRPDPRIHVLLSSSVHKAVDGRIKPGHDELAIAKPTAFLPSADSVPPSIP
jgi:hypothetical protein